jgi:acyl-CoA-binding protein
MADNSIVQGLFGINPEMYQQQQNQLLNTQATQFAELDPFQKANFGLYKGGSQLGNLGATLMGNQDPMLAKATMAKQLAGQFDLTSADGLKQYADALAKNGAPDLAQMAFARSQEVEKTALGNRKLTAETNKMELSAVQEEKLRSELAALGPNASEQAVISVVSKYGSPDAILKVLTASQDRKAMMALRASNASNAGIGALSPAQKSVDTKFGKDYNDFFAGGGINNLEKNLGELDRAIKIIEQSKEGDTSGKMVGLLDKTGMLAYAVPNAADVKDIIGGVAQSNLRQILGGQFAQKEGEALLARQYDTAQSKDKNLSRLKALYKQASETVADKKQAAMYYEQFGTLKGYKGSEAGNIVDSTTKSTVKQYNPATGKVE